MRQFLFVLLFVYALLGCHKNDENAPAYLKAAAEHCDCPQRKLEWLRDMVTLGSYATPGAKLPAPIQRISLSSIEGKPTFILDSDINACFGCPWAVLNCKGEPFVYDAKPTLFPTRDKIIWESY